MDDLDVILHPFLVFLLLLMLDNVTTTWPN